MKKYYIAVQFFTESGSFANPMPDDYELVPSKKAALAAARAWFSEVGCYSEEPCTVAVHYLTEEDLKLSYPCDDYPAAIIEQGKRGGAVWCNI